jgi:hypothetical protein
MNALLRIVKDKANYHPIACNNCKIYQIARLLVSSFSCLLVACMAYWYQYGGQKPDPRKKQKSDDQKGKAQKEESEVRSEADIEK